MKKKVTMEDIAKGLGITKNTVSLALRNMPGVSEKTKKQIFETAQSLGYKYKNYNSASHHKYKTRNICLMLSDNTRKSVSFFPLIQYGIESEAKKNNFNTILYCFDENKKFDPPLCINDGIISGIITLGRHTRRTISSIIDLNLPLVIIDHFFDDVVADYILSDNLSGGYNAVEYLIKLGHSKIGFSGNIFSSSSFFDRYLGYLKVMAHYKIPVNNNYSIVDKSFGDIYCNNIDKVAQELNKLPELPSAFFCCNDIEAITIIKALKYMKISVPDDISVIGFDNIDSSKNISPELTTMHINKESLGKRAVIKLIKRMNGDKSQEEKILLPVTLIERQSVKHLWV